MLNRSRLTPALICAFAVFLDSAVRARADSPTDAPNPSSPPSAADATAPAPANRGADQVTTLEKFTVSDVPVEDQVLPTVRPVTSAFGDARSIIDTPRSVSTINKAWMNDREIHDSSDFSQFAAGVYSPPQYGIAATPTIRGDTASIYFNGQLALYAGDNVFPSFNGVESMDIIKGPGSAVYGPQNNGVGGYVNFVNKKPEFDAAHFDVATTIGYWSSGHSYSNPEVTLDFSDPVTKDTAFRVSYLERWGSGYAQNQKNSTQDIYFDLSSNITKNLSINWWFDGYGSLFNENTGVDRVTEDYIGQQNYIAGSVLPNNAKGQPISIGNPATYTLQNGTKVTIKTGGTSLLLLNPATVSLVKLYPWMTLIGPDDSARAHRWTSQLEANLALSPDSSLENLFMFDNAFTRKFETYGFQTYMPVDYLADERLQYNKDYTLFGLKMKTIFGVEGKDLRTKSYSTSNEPYFLFDESGPSSAFVLPTFAATGIVVGWKVPGTVDYSAAPGSSTQDSRTVDSAAFWQQDIEFTSHISAVLGFREDRLNAYDASPYLQGVPSQGVPNEPYGAFYDTSAAVTDPSYFASLVFKPNETSSFYFTFDRVNANAGGGLGGVNAYSSNPIASPPHTVLTNNLKVLSKLYEIGYKTSLLNNTLYGSIDLFNQEHVTPQISPAPNVLIKSMGAEVELVYQPNKRLSFNANYTYQDLTSYASSFSEGTASYLDGYPTTLLVDGKYYGLGAGSPTSGAGAQYTYSSPTGKIRTPGLPIDTANFFVSYYITQHFGFGVGPQIIGRRPAAYTGPLYIPGEYQLDGFIFWRMKHWDVQVNLRNITNQNNFDPISATSAGNDVILPRPLITASLTARIHF